MNPNRHESMSTVANTLVAVGQLFKFLADRQLGNEDVLVVQLRRQEREISRDDCVAILSQFLRLEQAFPKSIRDEVTATVRLFLSHYKILGFIPEVAVDPPTLSGFSEKLLVVAEGFSSFIDPTQLRPDHLEEMHSRGFRGTYSNEDDFAYEVQRYFEIPDPQTPLANKHPEMLRIYLRMQLKAWHEGATAPTRQNAITEYRTKHRISSEITDKQLFKLLENHAGKHWQRPGKP